MPEPAVSAISPITTMPTMNKIRFDLFLPPDFTKPGSLLTAPYAQECIRSTSQRRHVQKGYRHRTHKKPPLWGTTTQKQNYSSARFIDCSKDNSRPRVHAAANSSAPSCARA